MNTKEARAIAEVVHKNGPVVVDFYGEELAWRPLDFGSWTSLAFHTPDAPDEEVRGLVERLRFLMAKATEGPWAVVGRDSPLTSLISANSGEETRNGGIYVARTQGPDSDHNVALIVEAINALPNLLDRITTASKGEWHPRIGERVEVRDDYPDAPSWQRVPLWVAGVHVAESGDGLDVTVAEQWPVPYRHARDYMGLTDGFYVGRANAPDDLRPLPSTPGAQNVG